MYYTKNADSPHVDLGQTKKSEKSCGLSLCDDRVYGQWINVTYGYLVMNKAQAVRDSLTLLNDDFDRILDWQL